MIFTLLKYDEYSFSIFNICQFNYDLPIVEVKIKKFFQSM